MSPRPLQIALAVLLLPALLGGCDAIYDDTKGWANRLEASILKLGEEPQVSPESAPEAASGTPPAVAAMPAPPAVPVEPVAVASLPVAEAPAARQPQPSPQTAEAPAPEGVLAAASAALLAPEPAPESKAKAETKPKPETKPEAEAKTETKTGAKTDKQTAALPPLPKAKPAVPAAPAEAAAVAPADASAAASADAPADAPGDAPGDVGVAAVLHLSSLRSEEAAKRQWSDLQRSFPEPLGGLQAQIRRTELGEKGTFYRVLAGPLPSRDAASQVCTALKAKDSRQYCRVVSAGPQS